MSEIPTLEELKAQLKDLTQSIKALENEEKSESYLIIEAVKHLKTIKTWLEKKRDIFNEGTFDTVEIDGKNIVDTNRTLWTDFLNELEPALINLLKYLEKQGICWPKQEDTV